MKRLVLFSAILSAMTGGCARAPQEQIAVRETPIVRLPIVPGTPGVAYLDVAIGGEPGDLVGVTSPQIGRIEMHESMTQGTMSAMRPLLRIPTHGLRSLSFAPGGRHLMLFDIASSVQPGSSVTLSFHFADGSSEDFTAYAGRAN